MLTPRPTPLALLRPSFELPKPTGERRQTRQQARHNARQSLKLTAKQSNIYVWGWQPNARFRAAACGRRFGKTELATKEIERAYRVAVQRNINPDNEIWYGAPTFKQAKRVFWNRLKRNFPKAWIKQINNSECYIVTITDHIIRLVGLDNYEALRGSGLWFFIGDEWADAKYECWTEVIRPMLATSGGHALFIGTPKGFNHFYRAYRDGQPGGLSDCMSWSYTTVEGGNVPESEIKHARETLDSRTFRQEWEASFETYSGRVYFAFRRETHVGTVDETKYNSKLPIHIGMDFNVNPMTATVWQEHTVPWSTLPLLIQIDELMIPTSDTVEMCNEIKTRYGKATFEPGKLDVSHITIYPDPAGTQRRTSAQGKTDISLLTDAGFTVIALRSHPLVRDRVNLVNGRFENADGLRHIKIAPKCIYSIESYERLAYKEGTSEPDKSLTYEGRDNITMDHLPDSTGYYIFARFGQAPIRNLSSNHMVR